MFSLVRAGLGVVEGDDAGGVHAKDFLCEIWAWNRLDRDHELEWKAEDRPVQGQHQKRRDNETESFRNPGWQQALELGPSL
jgi:hypothetical protein